jgi:hypothetical protein
MKRRFGAKVAKPYMRSMPWIVANHKKEDALPVLMIGENCRSPKVTIVEFGAFQQSLATLTMAGVRFCRVASMHNVNPAALTNLSFLLEADS